MKKQHRILSLEEAQVLVLKAQGLVNPSFLEGKEGAFSIIDQLGYLQIDTLNVVARSHHHTLWSRSPDYQEKFLNQLLETDKLIFEYWSHAASYLPMKDYRFTLPSKKLYADGKSHWFAQDKKMNKYVLDRIKAEGALQSKDFEFKRNAPGNWYDWKPAKQALEQLFMEGKLMVASRQNFQKIYDLSERIVPSSIDVSMPSKNEFASYLIKKTIQANAVVNESEIGYLRKGLKEVIAKEIKKMLKNGELLAIGIKSAKELYLTTPATLSSFEKSSNSKQKRPSVKNIHFLSPFDNAIIQRKRLNSLFGFNFNIECYLPESKRKFGYWCLPVLYNNKFVARFDPKADRATKTFYIKSIHFEENFLKNEDFNEIFVGKLKAFAAFNSCTKIALNKADKAWKRQVLSKL